MSAIVKYGGGFLAVIFGLPIMVGMCAGLSRSGSSNTSTAQAEAAPAVADPAPVAVAPIPVDALQLWRDYEANEVAADNQYKGRLLAVTGKVASIDKNFLGNIVVQLAAGNMFEHTMANMEPSAAAAAASLRKGAVVTVICKGGTRVIGSPTLDDCEFAR